MNRALISFAVLLCFLTGESLQSAPPEHPPLFVITTDHADAIYKQGETVSYTVRLVPDSQLPGDTELAWEISKDGVPPIQTGKVRLLNGSATITGKLNEPGHLLCRMTGMMNGKPVSALAGAAIDPLLIKPALAAPDDFDAFWNEEKKKLAGVPMNPRLTPVAGPVAGNVECFDVQLACVGGAPVSGYYARSRGASPQSLPIILLMQGAGVSSSNLNNAADWANHGLLAMDINAHGIANGKPEEFYRGLAQGALKGYQHFGRDSRETCYFLGMFLRARRALDFLTAQPEWDGKTIVVFGVSQGGFQAFATAYLDERVSFLVAGEPAGCDHAGATVGRVTGWPKLVSNETDGKPSAKELQTARYFDSVNFAARTNAKAAFLTVGFIDGTCPTSTVYAAYNSLSVPKNIFNDITSGHFNTPQSNLARNTAVLDYLKSVK